MRLVTDGRQRRRTVGVVEFRLNNGTDVVIRPIRPDDKARLAAALARLSDETRAQALPQPEAAPERHRAALPHRDRLRRSLGRGRGAQATTPRRSSASRAGSATSSDPQAAEAAIVIGDALPGPGPRPPARAVDRRRRAAARRAPVHRDDAVGQRRRAAPVRRDLRAPRRRARRRDRRDRRDARRLTAPPTAARCTSLAAVAKGYTLTDAAARARSARSGSTTLADAVDALELEARAFANTERRDAAHGHPARLRARGARRAARRDRRQGRPRGRRRARRRVRRGLHRAAPAPARRAAAGRETPYDALRRVLGC